MSAREKNWETKGLAKDFREASGAGVKRMRRKKLTQSYPANVQRCPDCSSPNNPHLCTGTKSRSAT